MKTTLILLSSLVAAAMAADHVPARKFTYNVEKPASAECRQGIESKIDNIVAGGIYAGVPKSAMPAGVGCGGFVSISNDAQPSNVWAARIVDYIDVDEIWLSTNVFNGLRGNSTAFTASYKVSGIEG